LDNLQTGSPLGRKLATRRWVTENIGYLGKLRQLCTLKAWQTHGNTLHEEAGFLPTFTRSGYARGTPLIDPRCLQGTAKRARIYDPFFLSVWKQCVFLFWRNASQSPSM